jgi:poly(3-hydroxybutyrate) depolymerase
MGDRARQVPLLVIQGVEDEVVVEEATTVPGSESRHPYVHTTLTTRDDAVLVESYLVEGMGHVWPGPDGDGLFTDHADPDASALVWDFVRRHARGSRP